MTQAEPNLPAPMPPSTIDFASVFAAHLKQADRETELRPANKDRLFDALSIAGITHVTVNFDGEGDSGQIESISIWAGALVLEGKTVVRLGEGMELHRSRVMGVNRIELSGFTEAQKDRLKADGFFSEIIAWKLRLFCPTDSGGVNVLDQLLARFPIQGLHARKGC